VKLILESIISLSGNVKFSLTLDPSVWIFDDRKVDLNTIFTSEEEQVDELEVYTKKVSEHWDREITEGAIYPPVNKSIKRFEKEKILNGSFGMHLKHFIKNAEPHEDSQQLSVHTHEGQVHTFPLMQAESFILGFSHEGKPLKTDGPVHIYFKDGSNLKNPIKNVSKFEIV
jgi:hypothetical protein